MKKIMLLATMAVAAVAFAAPAAAQAEDHFLDNGNPIVGTVATDLTGTIGFAVPGVGTFECEATAETSLGTLGGHLQGLNIDTEDCTGTGGFNHCKLVADALVGEPEVTATAPNIIDLFNVEITNTFATMAEGETDPEHGAPNPCGVAGLPLRLVFSEIEVETNGNPIEEGSISGTGGVFVGPNQIAVAEAYGTLEAVQSGTISIAAT